MDNEDVVAGTAMLLLLTAAAFVLKNKRTRQRRFKTRPIYRVRKQKGFFVSTFLPMKRQDPEQFFKYTRMTVPLFDELLHVLAPHLRRRHISDSISPEEKLEVTLQYLSQGITMQSLAWSHHMGITSIHKIINEVCPLIWEVLSEKYLKTPSHEDWLEISSGFYDLWNFPNCLGAIDGKHVNIEAPARSGSLYFNYKKTFSIILLAACDAIYIFRLVDIGAYGSNSDGGVFANSVFGKLLNSSHLNIPKETALPGTNTNFPFVFVADEAFPLKSYIMRPFPGKLLPIKKRIFNYRLSRARRMIENTFGIMVARWRLLKRTIIADVSNVDNFVKAIVCLHNYCQINLSDKYCPQGFADDGDEANGAWRQEIQDLQLVGRLAANRSANYIYGLRETLADFFISEAGSVPWQNQTVTLGQEPYEA